MSLSPTGDHSVVSDTLSAYYNSVSPVLSNDVDHIIGSLGESDYLTDQSVGSRHGDVVKIVDDIELDPVATEKNSLLHLFKRNSSENFRWGFQLS